MRMQTLVPALLALCAACGSVDPVEESQAAADVGAAAGYGISEPASAPAPAAHDNARELDAVELTGVPAQASLADSLRPPMLIRDGTVRIEVETLDTAVSAVRALAVRLGGHVANVSMHLGERQYREATITLRIPADRFDEAMGGLEPLGDLDVVEVRTEDVGEEYVDLERRLANARRLEARLLELLTTRTGELEDVLAVERELARVREQVERFEGRLRYLRTRVAVSTLAVTVHEPVPLTAHPGENLLVHATRQAGRNFLLLIAGVIASMGIIVPILLVAWGLFLLWRAWRRRRIRRADVAAD